MFENVLVGVDGRAGGRDAIALASKLAGREGKLAFVHVHPGAARPSRAIVPGMIREERDAARELLRSARAEASVEAELIELESTSPGRALHQQAEHRHSDLLVVGSCSRGVFGRVMLGDDTKAALNGAPCAVAVARVGYGEHPLPLAKIGVGYDGSPESEAALELARELSSSCRADLHALRVVTLPTYGYAGLAPPLIGESIEDMLKQASAEMSQLQGVAGEAKYGVAGEELAVFGDQMDLLVVGSRGYGPLKRLMLGSTSGYLAHHAHCSLLVLPRMALDESQVADQAAESATA